MIETLKTVEVRVPELGSYPYKNAGNFPGIHFGGRVIWLSSDACVPWCLEGVFPEGQHRDNGTDTMWTYFSDPEDAARAAIGEDCQK